MINYSRQLIETARAVLADGYYDCQSMQPDDLAVFQQSVASRVPEARRFTFNELRELVDLVNSRDDRDPDYEWVNSNGRSMAKSADESDEDKEDSAFQEGAFQDSAFQEGENAEEEANVPADEIDDPAAKALDDKRRMLEAVNRVLNIYYPYKTLSAATDFDRLRALFAEEVPDLAENISDERLKMFLFAVGGTLIGQLRPREERLAEAKRREANSGSVPSPRSYEQERASYEQERSSRFTPRPNAYDLYSQESESEQTPDASSDVGSSDSDTNERSLDAEAEAITRTFNSPRARLSQIRQNAPIRRTFASSQDESIEGADVGDRARPRRYDVGSNGGSSVGSPRYGERSNYSERPPRQGYGSAPYERQGYERYGYDRQGYDRQGYDRQGYDRQGYERQGYERQGYGSAPYERQGYERQGYERNAYSRDDYAERPYGSERFNAPSRPYYSERQGGYSRFGGNARYNVGYQSDGRSYDSDSNGSNGGRQSSYPASDWRNGTSNDGYSANNGYSTARAQGYSSLQEYRNTRGRVANDSLGANPAPTSVPFDPTNPPLADVVRAMREILTNYFPNKQVGLGADFRRLRMLTSFKFPQARFSDDKLQMFVAYAGGSLLGSSQVGDAETLLAPTDYSARKEDELREVAAQILRFFPGAVVDEAQGVEKFRALFNARFDEDSVVLSNETLKKLIRAVGGILPGQDDVKDANADVDDRFAALVDVAKTVLETKFSRSVFQRDLSDFTRFRIQFERLAGPGATLDDAELRDVFVAAGGVFEEEPKTPDKPIVKLARSVMIKKVVAENFPDGLDGVSHDDLDVFRQRAKEYDFDFDEETDVKLCAIIARCCVHYKDKLYSVSEEGKDRIKKLVESLFDVGAQVIYYETYFEKNAEWLKEYNVGCVGLLVTLLANYFSDYLFYPDYFEKTECEDSERVKIMREIERVWGAADAMTPEALAERLYAPVERIRKALEISVGNYAAEGDAFVHASSPSRSTVNDEELDDQFDVCFGNNDEEEKDEEKKEDIDDGGSDGGSDGESDAQDDGETTESEDARNDDDSRPNLFDMLLKEAEEEDLPSFDDEEEDEEETKVLKGELDARQETLEESIREYFPDGFNVESKDDLDSLKKKAAKDGRALIGSDEQILEQIKNCSLASDGRCFAVTVDAKKRIGELLDEWFNGGGKIVYYEIFWKKHCAELTEGGVFNERALIDAMKETRPNFCYHEFYVEKSKNNKSEQSKVKADVLRFWTTDVARRIYEFEAALYIPKKKVGETLQNDSAFTSSSNGYWKKTASKDAKATKSANGTKGVKTSEASKKSGSKKS